MDISTVNTIIGASATFIGAAILFVLGAVFTYARNINKNMQDLITMTAEHKIKLEAHKEQINELFNRVNSLQKIPA